MVIVLLMGAVLIVFTLVFTELFGLCLHEMVSPTVIREYIPVVSVLAPL